MAHRLVLVLHKAHRAVAKHWASVRLQPQQRPQEALGRVSSKIPISYQRSPLFRGCTKVAFPKTAKGINRTLLQTLLRAPSAGPTLVLLRKASTALVR